MRTVVVIALVATCALLVPVPRVRAGMVSDGGFGTPTHTLVLEDGGHRTPGEDEAAIEDGFLSPRAGGDGLSARLATVRAGLLAAADDAQCAPAKLERRYRRQLKGLGSLLAGVDGANAEATRARVARVAAGLRAYCAGVAAAGGLRAACAAELLAPCPRVLPGA